MITLKKGVVFSFGGQTYRGGSVRRGVIPSKVVVEIEKLNKKIEADNKENKTNNKTINLKKFAEVEKPEEKKNEGKLSGVKREPSELNG